MKKNSSTYNLSILVGMDRFSYAIMDKEKNLLALKSYLLNADLASSQQLHPALQAIFLEDENLKLPYQNTNVGLINNKCTFVPNKFFQLESTDAYLKNQVATLEKQQVFVDELEMVDAKNVYAYNQEVYFLIKGFLPQAKFFHNSSTVLQGFLNLQKGKETQNVYVNVKGDHLQIALMNGEELVFYNSYPYQTEHDFIYYVMLVFDQFKLDTGKTPVFLSGQIATDSKIYRIIYRYINQVDFAKIPSSIHFGKNANGTPAHFYFDLYSLGLCEL